MHVTNVYERLIFFFVKQNWKQSWPSSLTSWHFAQRSVIQLKKKDVKKDVIREIKLYNQRTKELSQAKTR